MTLWGRTSSLTHHHVDTIDTVATICSGEALVWHGITARETHTYTNIETQPNGDQVYYRLDLTVKPVEEVEKHLTMCQGTTVSFNGKEYTAPGTYYDRYNCDTVYKVIVAMHPVQVYITNATLVGSSYTWEYGGLTKDVTTPGTYTEKVTNADGCTDTYRLILAKDETAYHFEEAYTVCEGEDFVWHGRSGLSSQGIGTTTDYYDNYKTAAGKDSIYHLALTVTPLKRSSRTITFCTQTEWRGKIYNESAVVYDTVASSTGCDSIVRIYLDKAPRYVFHDTATIVQGEILSWYDLQINKEGLYRKVFTTVNGCDSIYEIGVGLVAATPQQPMYTTRWSICEGDVYTWDHNNKDYMASGTYVDTVKAALIDDPDTVYVLNLTVWPVNKDTVVQHLYSCSDEGVIRYNGTEYTADATVITTFKTVHNCDSVVKTFLHFNTAKFTSDTMRLADTDTTRMWHEQKINHAGTYRYETKVEGECYNREELIVFMYPTYRFVKDTAICQTEAPYRWWDGPQDPDKLAIEYSHAPGETKTYEHKYLTVEGYDSVYVLNLTIYPSYIIRQQLHLCEGDIRTVNGKVYQNLVPDSVYRDTTMLRSVNSCDSIVYTEIIQHPIKRIVTDMVLHLGDTIFWEGDTITGGGEYQKIYPQAVNGCDSIRELHVTQEMLEEKVICLLDTPYTWREHDLYTSGFWRDTVKDDRGFITELWKLNLTVTTPPDTTIYLHGCEKVGVTWRDRVYLEDTTFVDRVPVNPFNPENPCDTVYTVNIKIDTIYNIQIDTFLCEHQLPLIIGRQDPDTIWAEGLYTNPDTTACGCDSTVSVRLFIIPDLTKNDSIIVCERDVKENPVVLGDTVNPAFILKDGGKWADEKYWKGPEKWKWHGVPYQDDTIVWNCDSTYFFHVIVKPQVINDDTIYICEGDSMELGWPHPRWIKEPGEYFDTLQSYKGWMDTVHHHFYNPNDFSCDSITRHIVIMTKPLYGDTTAHIPQGDSLMWDGEWRHFTGDYVRITEAPDTNYLGEHCKKVDTLHLFVEPTYYFRDTISICYDPAITYSHVWKTDGHHVQKFNTPNKDVSMHFYDSLKTVPWRFDSIYDLYVNFHAIKRTRISAGLCEGDSMRFGLTKSNKPRFISKTGIYTDTLIAKSNGCDSIIELTLNIYPKYLTHKQIDIADVDTPFVWEHIKWICGVGHVMRDSLYAEGGYAYKMESDYGCDSIDSVTLKIHPTYLYKDTITICSNETPYTWEGIKDIYETGTFTKKLKTQDGYDSTLVRHVIVLPVKRTTIRETICEGDSIRFGLSKQNRPRFLHDADTYYDTLRTAEGCDSIISLILNVYPKFLRYKQVDIRDVDTPYIWEHVIVRGMVKDTLRDTLRASGEYSRRLETVFGCDSIDSLSLKIHNTYLFTEEITICEQETPYTWMNRNDITNSGTFFYNPRTKDGYDSIFIATITVKPTARTIIRHSMCEGSEYLFDGKTYTTGVTVNDTLTGPNGCDSIVTLILTVNKPYHNIEKVDILQGQSVEFFGNTYNTSGTYTHFNTTPEGCDSTSILQLTVHQLVDTVITICSTELPYIWYNKWSGAEERYYASGTYRNDSTFEGRKHYYGMQLIVNEPVFKTIKHSMCEGAEYQFGGKTYTTGVTVKDTLRAQNGCDSIVTLILTINKPYHNIEKVDILQGQSVEFFGNTYNTSGTYTHFNTTPEGCDSTSILQLTVHQLVDTVITICSTELPYIWYNKWSGEAEKYYASGTYRNDSTFEGRKHYYGMQLIVNEPVFKTIKHSMCEGAEYQFGGKTYTTGVTVKDTLRAQNGCDSIVTLILTVNKPYHNIEKVDILQGQSVEFFGNTYNTSGTYTHFNTTPEGCDSTSILQLTVHQLVDTVITICSTELPYIWYNKWSGEAEKYYASGTYRNDSTFEGKKHYYGMQLKVNMSSDTIIYRSICEGSYLNFNGQRISKQGEYRDTLKNVAGCDSIVRLNLAVLPLYHNIVNRTIFEGDTVHFENKVYSEAGRYPFRYTSGAGCDSIIELNLTVRKVFDDSVSVCYSDLPYEWKGKQIYQSGIVRDTTYDSEGKQIITGLKVTVLPTFRASEPIVKVICEGDYFAFNGKNLTKAGTYYDTLTAVNGCDSIISLSLQVIPQNIQSNTKLIYEGDSVFFDGKWRKESGIYEYTEKGPSGCMDIYRLAVTVLKQFNVDTTAYVCSNELPYVWHGIAYHEAGDYTVPTSWTDSSRVITTLHLVINPASYFERSISLCEGSTFIYKGKGYTKNGFFYDTIPSMTGGCDSVYKFIISVQPTYDRIDTVHISDKESYDFNGRILNQSGYYEHSGKTVNGCDSMMHLVLVVHPSYYNFDSINLCQGDTLDWHGQKIFKSGLYSDSLLTETYNFDSVYQVRVIVHEKYFKEQQYEITEGYQTFIHGINISQPGIYYDSLLTVHGCDSVYQIVVNWARKFTQHWNITICQGEYYEFFGAKLTHTGDYDHTSIKGDSTIYLHLTVNPTSISEERVVISPEDLPYIYKEHTYESAGVYTDTFHNRFKCDSVTRLVLVVSDHVSEWAQMPLCPGQTIKIEGTVIDTAGLYTFVKRSKVSGLLDSLYRVEVYDAPDYESAIDSIVICEGDTVNFAGKQIWRGGLHTANLKTVHGCDSILHIYLTVNPSYLYPTSATITDYQTYTWRGKEYDKNGIFEQSYPTIKDCDSTYRLNLTVIETKRIVVNDSICYRDTLRWRNHILTDPGTYSDTICNLASLTSVIYTLNLGVVTPTIIQSASVTETAADVESFNINFTYTGLRPNTYSIQFDELAHAEGFEDIVNKPFGPDIIAEVPMPHKTKVVYQEHTEYVRPNYYTMRLALDNGVCGVSRSDSLSLLIRYPSWIIEQNWDDVVAPLRAEYNGGYEFGAYTWYVNDAPYANGGLPYLYSKTLKPGDQVVLYATRIGESYTIPTAPLTITAPVPNVFPNPVLVYPTAVSKVKARVNIQSESDGTYKVYSSTGQLFSTGDFESGEHEVALPAVSGCCFIQATTNDGYSITQKILVY